jgi:hypothetical protein
MLPTAGDVVTFGRPTSSMGDLVFNRMHPFIDRPAARRSRTDQGAREHRG